MEPIREYLKRHILLTDGANGTYISALTGRNTGVCESLNLSNPDLVGRVHREYVDAGSSLITTNTFCANSLTLGRPHKEIREMIRAGYEIALKATDGKAYVAADIGPIPEGTGEGKETESDWELRAQREYERVADAFLEQGAEIFLFETFPEAKAPLKTAAYIRKNLPEAFILISFAVLPDGRTRLGRKGKELLEEVKASGLADAAGFNCCSGPAHLLSYASSLEFGALAPMIMPNAGYPFRQEDSVVYPGTPAYFAEKLSGAAAVGFQIIGGCCGTTPAHIRSLSEALRNPQGAPAVRKEDAPGAQIRSEQRSAFQTALKSGKKVVLVELDPPGSSDFHKFDEATRLISDCGADAITIADSPMARPRADSVAVAARLKRLSGLDVIPHVSCRDKNINAIKSSLIAAHVEGIRNILAVTGDPVPDADRGAIKSVFNLNSASLCGFIGDLNADIFQGDEMACGCAFNVNARNPDHELSRLTRKLKNGASFVLTQPVFSEASIEALKRAKKETGARMIAGILTPVSYRNIMFLANEMPGIEIPEEIIRRFSSDMTREDGENAGIRISVDIASRIAEDCDGYYFIIPFNRVAVTARILTKLRSGGVLLS